MFELLPRVYRSFKRRSTYYNHLTASPVHAHISVSEFDPTPYCKCTPRLSSHIRPQLLPRFFKRPLRRPPLPSDPLELLFIRMIKLADHLVRHSRLT